MKRAKKYPVDELEEKAFEVYQKQAHPNSL